MSDKKAEKALSLGVVLCRFVIPSWILVGAIFKLVDKSPRLLPREIWEGAARLGMDLYILLAIIVAIEITAAGVMFLSHRLSRLVGALLMGAFCLVLINEMRVGNTSCGCLGSISPSPWIMLLVDGSLLLGATAYRPSPRQGGIFRPILITLASASIGALLAYVLILPERNKSAPVVDQSSSAIQRNVDRSSQGKGGESAAVIDPKNIPGEEVGEAVEIDDVPPRLSDDLYGAGLVFSPKPPPPVYVPTVEDWVGKRLDEIELSQFMPDWPNGDKAIGHGRQYLIFYSRSCPHCEEIFEFLFQPPPVPTTVVAIPETKEGWDFDSHRPMNYQNCREYELAVGTDWLITSPLILALENGVIRCVEIGVSAADATCLLWH